MPKEVSQRTRLWFAITAGVVTAIFSTMILDISRGVLAHATVEQLHEVSSKCHEELIELKKDMEKAKKAREEADERLAVSTAKLAEAVQMHITQDAMDTQEIKTNIEWIKRGVDRLMEDNVLKPEYRMGKN